MAPSSESPPTGVVTSVPPSSEDISPQVVTKDVTGSSEESLSFWERQAPNKYYVGPIKVRTLNLDVTSPIGEIALHGVGLDIAIDQASEAYKFNLQGGSFSIPWDLFPKGTLESGFLRYSRERVTISSLKALVGQKGRMEVVGDWNPADEYSVLNFSFKDVDLKEIVPDSWIKSLEGRINATAKATRAPKSDMVFQGELEADRSVLTAMPMLDTLAVFSGTQRFRRIDWNTARSKFSHQGDILRFDQILLVSEGLVRVEGWVGIENNDKLTGELMIGIPEGLLAHIPGAETAVFTKANNGGRYGLLWAPVNLSGTLDDPREDLTNRLIYAAGQRIIEVLPGGDVLLKRVESVLDLLTPKEGSSSGEGDDDKDKDSRSPIKVGTDLLKSLIP